MRHKRGITREVFLIGKYAIKIPSFRSWKLFLSGILCNIQEKEFCLMDGTCPIIFASPLRFIIVMPKCTESGLTNEEAKAMSKQFRQKGIPVEGKPCSFGWLNDKLVAIDYGS